MERLQGRGLRARKQRDEEVVEGLGYGGRLVELFGAEVGHFGKAKKGFGSPAANGDGV